MNLLKQKHVQLYVVYFFAFVFIFMEVNHILSTTTAQNYNYWNMIVVLWVFGSLYLHVIISGKILKIDFFYPFRKEKIIQIDTKYKIKITSGCQPDKAFIVGFSLAVIMANPDDEENKKSLITALMDAFPDIDVI